MYKGFCINKSTIIKVVSQYKNKHSSMYRVCEQSMQNRTSDFKTKIATIIKGDASGIINGDALRETCMPTSENHYDVFISHYHVENDNTAEELAVLLKAKYGVTCFVDSFVWGSCDKDILLPIDTLYSPHDTKKGSYSYEKRNFSTSHVHAMLSMALLEMMYNCECCIFIKPQNTYSLSNIENHTLSPWIYEELTMFNKVQKYEPERQRKMCESFSASPKQLTIQYKLDLSNMKELTEDVFEFTPVQNGTYKREYQWLDHRYNEL